VGIKKLNYIPVFSLLEQASTSRNDIKDKNPIAKIFMISVFFGGLKLPSQDLELIDDAFSL